MPSPTTCSRSAQHLECRWYRDQNGHLQRKWTRVGTHLPDTSPKSTHNVASPNTALGYETAEMWLKVMVHVAGFAALSAVPAVAALLADLSDGLRLLP